MRIGGKGGRKEEDTKAHSFHQNQNHRIDTTYFHVFCDYHERLLVTISYKWTMLLYVFIARKGASDSRSRRVLLTNIIVDQLENTRAEFQEPPASALFRPWGSMYTRTWNVNSTFADIERGARWSATERTFHRARMKGNLTSSVTGLDAWSSQMIGGLDRASMFSFFFIQPSFSNQHSYPRRLNFWLTTSTHSHHRR